jgi:hypothetical protein
MNHQHIRSTWIAIALGVSLSVTLTQASAEPFVDRGILWISAAPGGTYQTMPQPRATVEYFNSRGTQWTQLPSTKTYSSKAPVDTKAHGWMQK